MSSSGKEIKRLVVHCKRKPFDVYIGRPSRWGNPFMIGKDGTRDEVIEKYRKWIETQPQLLVDVHTLKGKVLGCWCAPQRCHGEVLVELAEAIQYVDISEGRTYGCQDLTSKE